MIKFEFRKGFTVLGSIEFKNDFSKIGKIYQLIDSYDKGLMTAREDSMFIIDEYRGAAIPMTPIQTFCFVLDDVEISELISRINSVGDGSSLSISYGTLKTKSLSDILLGVEEYNKTVQKKEIPINISSAAMQHDILIRTIKETLAIFGDFIANKDNIIAMLNAINYRDSNKMMESIRSLEKQRDDLYVEIRNKICQENKYITEYIKNNSKYASLDIGNLETEYVEEKDQSIHALKEKNDGLRKLYDKLNEIIKGERDMIVKKYTKVWVDLQALRHINSILMTTDTPIFVWQEYQSPKTVIHFQLNDLHQAYVDLCMGYFTTHQTYKLAKEEKEKKFEEIYVNEKDYFEQWCKNRRKLSGENKKEYEIK